MKNLLSLRCNYRLLSDSLTISKHKVYLKILLDRS